jgi:hypothetical protein
MKTRILRIAPVQIYEVQPDTPGERHYLVRSRDEQMAVLVCFTAIYSEPDLGIIRTLGTCALIQRTAAKVLGRQRA